MKVMILALLLVSCSTIKYKNKSTTKYNERLDGYTYPFKVSNYKFNSQNQELEMAYMDLESPSKSKGVVVLLHGKNFSGFYWERIAKKLQSKGYRVIIPDQIGFGKSSKPKAYQYSFTQLALNTQNLLKSINVKKYLVVGHSMGGMLATTMANMFERNVKELILLNPIGLETYLDYAQFKDTNFFYKNELSKTKEKIIRYQKKNYYDGKWSKEYEKLIGPTVGQLNGGDWKNIAWNNALTYGPIFSEDIVARLKNIVIPTTLLIGTRDKTGPGRNWKKHGVTYELGRYDLFAKRFKKYLPTSKVITLSGLGHMPQFEDYKRFSKAFYNLFE